MKKNNQSTHNKIVRLIVTYFVCLLLAVLTWTLVMYAEHEANGEKSTITTVSLPLLAESDCTVL